MPAIVTHFIYVFYRQECQEKHDGSCRKNSVTPAITYFWRRHQMLGQRRSDGQPGQQSANVSRVIDANPR